MATFRPIVGVTGGQYEGVTGEYLAGRSTDTLVAIFVTLAAAGVAFGDTIIVNRNDVVFYS